jgi:hypothetical protein
MIQVRVVQKTDTGKIYAMKTLRKSEMFKKDQVCEGSSLHLHELWLTMHCLLACSSPTSEPSETSWPKATHTGLSSYTIPSKTRHIFTFLWNSYQEEI